jgi:hypothetical protein
VGIIAKKYVEGDTGLLSRLFSSLKVEDKIDEIQVFQFYDGTCHYHAWSTNAKKTYVWPLVKKAILSEDRCGIGDVVD